MLDVKQKQFLTILVLVALIFSNLVLFALWNESKSNIEIIKTNAVNKLIECECDGFERINSWDKNNSLSGLMIPLK
jgi:competence protein ComGC